MQKFEKNNFTKNSEILGKQKHPDTKHAKQHKTNKSKAHAQ